MVGNIGSTFAKELFCFFHIGGKFVGKAEGGVKYDGGFVRLKTIKEGISLEELRLTISGWIGVAGSNCNIKYTVTFDDNTLIDLADAEEVENLFKYNDNNAHVYVGCKENDNAQEVIDDLHMFEYSQGVLDQSCGPMNGAMGYENANERLTYEVSRGHTLSQPCGEENALIAMPELNSAKWKGMLLGVMQRFAHADAFREAVYKFSIAHQFEFKYVKNSKHKMSVKCKVEGCPWKVTASAVGKSSPLLRVTKFTNEHIHSAQDNLEVKHPGRSSLTSTIIIDEVRNHAEKRPHEIRKTLQQEYGVKLTYKQAYRAKEKAMEDVHGRPEQTYMLIPWICQRLKETDNKTVAEWVSSGSTFERVFIAYGCCIEGFLAAARPILYIDGTHLSGPYKGTMLAASAYDADNELFPFAYAIVNGETLEEWTWFLHMIKQIVGSLALTIVSDRHNAIIGGVEAIFGGDRHAFCYRHVKENFSSELMKLNRGKRKISSQMKDDLLKLLDDVAYARLDSEFDKAMGHMQNVDLQLFEWIINKGDVHKWALSKFPYRRWDNITTNLAESYNAWMVKERRHNVAQLIHEHREKVARKMYAASQAISKWRNGIGPNIDAKLKESVCQAEFMDPEPYGSDMDRVHTCYGHLMVHLRLRECTCKEWQMTGIPCPHACAAIRIFNGNVYDYVEECYKVTSQERIYSRCMIPVVTIDMPHPNDYRLENVSSQIFLRPPLTNRPPGRPRVRRHESQFQNKKVYHCARCHLPGHTRRTCKNPNPSSL